MKRIQEQNSIQEKQTGQSKICRVIYKKILFQLLLTSLRQLTRVRYALSTVVELTQKPVSIRIIGNRVWCCEGDVISIWTPGDQFSLEHFPQLFAKC